MQISLKTPGIQTPLPRYILQQLKNLHPRFKRHVGFFGGHPVSITKQSANQIFNDIVPKKQDGTLQSQYLVCQKTDGVRYLLIISHVRPQENQQQQNQLERKNQKLIKCYLVSRQGQKKLVAYQAEMNLGTSWLKQKQGQFQNIIEILDGQLIIDRPIGKPDQKIFKYLIFDILVHFGQNITSLPLIMRIKQINRFVQCNNFLLQKIQAKIKNNRISLELKDFFRLNCQKYNTIKFLLYKYIKCLPHENDGLIFNHQAKPYEFGMNNGYIKWKPAHLNTLDFMLVPNTNLSDNFGNRVLDMYLAVKDSQIQGNYIRSFYSFTIVSQKQFEDIQNMLRQNKDKLYEKHQDDQDNQMQDKGHFLGAVIAQCKFQQTSKQERQIFRELFDIKKQPSEIYQSVMKPFNQQMELRRISSLQKVVYDKCWKIYKIRDDKGLPNNIQVAERIEQSIKDDIQEEDIIKKNDQLNEKCRPKF